MQSQTILVSEPCQGIEHCTMERRSSLRASLRSRLCLFLLRRASNWSAMFFSRSFSAFWWWMASVSTRLFLYTLPFTCSRRCRGQQRCPMVLITHTRLLLRLYRLCLILNAEHGCSWAVNSSAMQSTGRSSVASVWHLEAHSSSRLSYAEPVLTDAIR